MIAVNKADGDNRERATRAASDYANAMHIMTPASANWTPPVVTCSALENEGLDALWETILDHRERMTESGELADKRRMQSLRWMWAMVEDRIMGALRDDPSVAQAIGTLEAEVAAGKVTPTMAADRIIEAFKTKS